ncbi:hypothetical protein DXG03_000463 [Asterophora parasitica]|uniref:Uncharacterized protein n=1 Tax=Asterophora parasitica TaxID=117018 RepID=A0A9P7GC80_9AGAR|nr:hypothetical protein DXG03_000463 [Asterophora parasitica]
MNSNICPQQLTPQLELCISASVVGSYLPTVQPTAIARDALASELESMSLQEPSFPDNHLIRLLSGPLNEFLKYSAQEQSQWLMDVAHDIFDPTLKRGSLTSALSCCIYRPAYRSHLPIYVYVVQPGVVLGLTKLSRRQGKYETTAAASGTMDNCVMRRDESYWMTRSRYPIENSHICPKRMGDHLAHIIFSTFPAPIPSAPIPPISILDERFGITLKSGLHEYFTEYEMLWMKTLTMRELMLRRTDGGQAMQADIEDEDRRLSDVANQIMGLSLATR